MREDEILKKIYFSRLKERSKEGQKQPPIGVLRKKCSENMQRI